MEKDYKEIQDKLDNPDMTLEEALENIRVQHAEHKEKAKYHSELALMAHGAIQVLEQLCNNQAEE